MDELAILVELEHDGGWKQVRLEAGRGPAGHWHGHGYWHGLGMGRLRGVVR